MDTVKITCEMNGDKITQEFSEEFLIDMLHSFRVIMKWREYSEKQIEESIQEEGE